MNALCSQKIFFAHMSVGNNILEGIGALKKSDSRLGKLYIYDMQSFNEIDSPGIYHIKVGHNGDPIKKCNAFKELVQSTNVGKWIDIAVLKFCYVDFDKNSDVHAIFNYYLETVTAIKRDFPNLIILHVTIPLTTHTQGLKSIIKSLIMPDVANVKRNQFNQLVREKYQSGEPIFDLANVESTCPDGNRSSFKYSRNTYYSLCQSYSQDGGHLNEIASQRVAGELFGVLATVAASSTR